MGLTLRLIKGSKLTYQEMDDNLTYLQSIGVMGSSGSSGVDGLSGSSGTSGGGGGGSLIEINQSDIATLIIGGTVTPNAMYLIHGVDTELYGGTDIILMGLDATSFSPTGFGKFYNPPYILKPVWDTNGTYNIGDAVIYGGIVWVNVQGNIGNNPDYFNLNTDDWTPHPPVGDDIQTYYNTVWDEIKYDITNDFIETRYEVAGNNLVEITYATRSWFFCGFNPIAVFRWGNPYNSGQGVGDCHLSNSYMECLNYISGSIQAVSLTNGCIIANTQLINNSWIQNLIMENYAQMFGILLDNSGLYDFSIKNDSIFIEFEIGGSELDYISINNNSAISAGTIANSNTSNLRLDNQSTINNLTINSGALSQNVLDNGTRMDYVSLTNSNISGLQATSGYISQINLTNDAYWEFVTINDGDMVDITMNSGHFSNYQVTGSSLNLNDFGSLSNITIIGAISEYNTIKYQGVANSIIGATGPGGSGPIAMPFFPVPPGFFGEKLLMEFTGTISGPDSILNIGIDNIDTQSLCNNANGGFGAINNKIWSFDISNGEANGAKNTSGIYQTIVGSLNVNPVTDFSIDMEVVLKNITYTSNND